MGVNVDIAKGVETRYDTSGKLALPLPFKKIKKLDGKPYSRQALLNFWKEGGFLVHIEKLWNFVRHFLWL